MNSKQESLFKDDQKRTRKVEKFVRTGSKDGTLSVIIDPDIAIRIRKYCRTRNLNCKKLIEKIIREKLDELEPARLEEMNKDELIAYIQRMEAEREGEA